jgi:hypothetical protein
MGDSSIPDPLTLEQRCLDIQYENKALRNQVEKMTRVKQEKIKPIKSRVKQMCDKIRKLEE